MMKSKVLKILTLSLSATIFCQSLAFAGAGPLGPEPSKIILAEDWKPTNYQGQDFRLNAHAGRYIEQSPIIQPQFRQPKIDRQALNTQRILDHPYQQYKFLHHQSSEEG